MQSSPSFLAHFIRQTALSSVFSTVYWSFSDHSHWPMSFWLDKARLTHSDTGHFAGKGCLLLTRMAHLSLLFYYSWSSHQLMWVEGYSQLSFVSWHHFFLCCCRWQLVSMAIHYNYYYPNWQKRVYLVSSNNVCSTCAKHENRIMCFHILKSAHCV